jgi:hypothetical protein
MVVKPLLRATIVVMLATATAVITPTVLASADQTPATVALLTGPPGCC